MKNKIHNYDFLIVGAGLIGSLAALYLNKFKYKVLVIEKSKILPKDDRTLAVNANSKDFLKNIGLWEKINKSNKPEPINKIEIKDNINKSSLIFQDSKEEMGNVVFNRDLIIEARKALKKNNLLLEGIAFNIPETVPNLITSINDKNYIFSNVILSLGKKYQDDSIIKKFIFSSDYKSLVGFFTHSINHNQIAYEIFSQDGPIAVLPCPDKLKKKSTFIYSSKKKISKKQIEKLLKKEFSKSHGKIKLSKQINQFDVIPHFSKDKYDKYILIGDTLRSIHPVAGQGWNLGIKDIQTLGTVLDKCGPKNPNLIKKYYSYRILESVGYLSFTSSLNFLYENQNPFTIPIIRTGFKILKKFDFLRSTFIKQAMGRFKLI